MNPTPEERMPKPQTFFPRKDLDLIIAWRNELAELPETEENK